MPNAHKQRATGSNKKASLQGLRRDIQQGVKSIKDGRISHASADEVIAKAESRKKHLSALRKDIDAGDADIMAGRVTRYGSAKELYDDIVNEQNN